MKMLALEFSSDRRSVAVAESSSAGAVRLLAETSAAQDASIGPLALIQQALERAEVGRGDIGAVAIGLGPGSYTGIRMAIATAQGWKIARDVALNGVSSVDIIAWDVWKNGGRGSACVAVDAQRGDFHLARFELAGEGPRCLAPLELVSNDAVATAVSAGARVFMPESRMSVPGAEAGFPTAATLAEVSLRRPESRIALLEPIYLRPVAFAKAPPAISVPGL